MQAKSCPKVKVSLSEFMARACAVSYCERDTIQEEQNGQGDFVTAPQLSQIFGEICGLFLAERFLTCRGSPRCDLVELGPGTGALVADALRAVRAAAPSFFEVASLHLVEMSPRLRKKQKEVLETYGKTITWHDAVDSVSESPSDGPLFLIANEFFDALPVDQLVYDGHAWQQVFMEAEGGGVYREALGPVQLPPAQIDFFMPEALPQPGVRLELSLAACVMAENICIKLKQRGGCALIIDYGPTERSFGCSVQAIRKHKPVSLGTALAEADISAHVPFFALRGIALRHGLRVYGPVSQKDFLDSMGLRERTHALQKAHREQAHILERQYQRLAGDDFDPRGMGQLFKVLVIESS